MLDSWRLGVLLVFVFEGVDGQKGGGEVSCTCTEVGLSELRLVLVSTGDQRGPPSP